MRRVITAAQATMKRVANIDARGRRRRLIGGAAWLGVGTLASAALRFVHAADGWYALLFVPFMLAALGYFQARDWT